MTLPSHLLPTTVVGSYPQPDWLLNRQMLSKIVPRTRMQELWRIPEEFLEQAQDDATVLAIRDMERAGIGYLVTLNRTILDSPRVFAAILLILLLSIAYYLLSRAIERRFVVWQSAGKPLQPAQSTV